MSVFGLAAAVFGVLPQVAQRQETTAAAEALRLLQGTPPKGDSAGADALWLMAYDIPDATERRRIMAKLGNHLPKDEALPAELRSRRLPELKNGELNCTTEDGKRGAGCLSTVRAHREAFQAGVKNTPCCCPMRTGWRIIPIWILPWTKDYPPFCRPCCLSLPRKPRLPLWIG